VKHTVGVKALLAMHEAVVISSSDVITRISPMLIQAHNLHLSSMPCP
jgi:hypothetical protein